jgi:hypothetical protein
MPLAMPFETERTGGGRGRPLGCLAGKEASAMAQSTTAPYVSVIVPAYNSALYITAALNSVLEQTWDLKREKR